MLKIRMIYSPCFLWKHSFFECTLQLSYKNFHVRGRVHHILLIPRTDWPSHSCSHLESQAKFWECLGGSLGVCVFVCFLPRPQLFIDTLALEHRMQGVDATSFPQNCRWFSYLDSHSQKLYRRLKLRVLICAKKVIQMLAFILYVP